MANISVSTVGGILKDLKSDNYILQISEGEKKLHNKGELLSHWVTAFNQKLKPKLFRGRYRFGQPYSQGSWKSLDLGNYAFWGGEPAADHYTNYLFPEIWAIYTNLDKRSIVKDLQLRPAPALTSSTPDLLRRYGTPYGCVSRPPSPYNPIRRATPLLANIPNNTMLIELSGIRMAATMGERAPCTAKLRPMIL